MNDSRCSACNRNVLEGGVVTMAIGQVVVHHLGEGRGGEAC